MATDRADDRGRVRSVTDIVFLVLWRLRMPLIALVVVYAISVLGLALTPGVDPAGRPWRLGFFHAFYVMSYTATTIGFGEVPYPFSDAQRAWLIVSIYLSVIGWTYFLGSLFSLTNDPTFRATVARAVFRRRTRMLTEPFFIICGCGQSGSALGHALDRMGLRVVMIDNRTERVSRIAIAEFRLPPITLEADARNPEVLADAGIHKPECRGVIAVVSQDNANQTIAIGAKVLNAGLTVIARVKDLIPHNNLSAFGGVHVINPFRVLATNIALDIAAPEVLRLEDWLTGAPGSPCPSRVNVPKGPWVLVGYGRFGQTIAETLDEAHVEWRALDPGEGLAREARVPAGDNTETALRAAGISEAAVIVAGTDDDSVNLGMTTLARRINPDIFVVIRQNDSADRVLIDEARANLRFVQSDLMVHESLQILKTPMLGDFIQKIREGGSAQASRVIERIMATVGDASPHNWELHCDPLQPGMFGAFFHAAPEPARIGHLLANPADRDERLHAVALMRVRRGVAEILPDPTGELRPGDRLLFVGDDQARRMQGRFLVEPDVFDYVRSGESQPAGWLFRRIASWRRTRQPAARD